MGLERSTHARGKRFSRASQSILVPIQIGRQKGDLVTMILLLLILVLHLLELGRRIRDLAAVGAQGLLQIPSAKLISMP